MQTIHSFEPHIAADNPVAALLQSSLAQTSADSAYVYRFEANGEAAQLVAWAGPVAPVTAAGPVEGWAVRWHFDNGSPLILQEDAWADSRFEGFPEFQRNRFQGVASIPLVDSGVLAGVAHFCRTESAGLRPRELAFLLGLSSPLGSLLAGAVVREKLRQEVEKLAQQLAGRKSVERAKGILQSRFGWSEEEAYHHVRRLSRQRRIPMQAIADEVIQQRA